MHQYQPQPNLRPEERHRRSVLKALVGFTAFGGILFFFLNSFRGQHLLASAELITSILSFGLFIVVGRTRKLKLWSMVYLLILFSVVELSFTLPGTSPTLAVWVFLIPILSYLLMGRQYGFWMSAVFLAAAAIIYLLRYSSHPDFLSPVALVNVVICALSIFLFSHIYEVNREESHAALLELATTDPLTKLANRTRFQYVFEREQARAVRDGTPLSLLVIDADHFKRINDLFGHEVGDNALKLIASTLQSRLRATDLAARMGGEEFAVILPGATRLQASHVGEEIRAAMAMRPFIAGDERLQITLTMGVSEFHVDGENLITLYRVADERLYQGKSDGRNRVIWDSQTQSSLNLSLTDALSSAHLQ